MEEPGQQIRTPETVSRLTERLRHELEPRFSDVLIEGELSNISRSRNGHLYFTAKDSEAQIPCVVWNRTVERLRLDPQEGRQMILGGSIRIYPPHGRYQLIVDRMEEAGVGQLQQEFEKLKEKLRREGLFDTERKRALPPFPRRIGVVTSSTGAAFHDIASTLERRWPLAELLLCHASVQGSLAAGELVRGIRRLGGEPGVDLLIVGRGGGSLEDLWPFNEEIVARAIFDSPIPVISAVGHETDFSISDFVADVRAATPTQAAVLAAPDIAEVRLLLDDLATRAERRIRERVERLERLADRLERSHALLVIREKIRGNRSHLSHLNGWLRLRIERTLPEGRERLSAQRSLLERRLERSASESRERLTGLLHRLSKQNPDEALEKGFVRVWQRDRWIRRSAELDRETAIELQWRDGKITL